MRKLEIHGKTYSELYRFDGGTYFVPDNAVADEPWIALMDDGTLNQLYNGIHVKWLADYTVTENEQ